MSDQLRGADHAAEQADRFLTFAARQQSAADDLRAALARVGGAGRGAGSPVAPTIDLAPYTVIGDVGRRVSDAVEMASFSWAGDARRPPERRAAGVERGRQHRCRAVGPGSPVEASWSSTVGGAGDRLASCRPVGPSSTGPGSRVGTCRATQLRLEHLALAELWARRADNHLFDGLAPPPELLDGDRLRAGGRARRRRRSSSSTTGASSWPSGLRPTAGPHSIDSPPSSARPAAPADRLTAPDRAARPAQWPPELDGAGSRSQRSLRAPARHRSAARARASSRSATASSSAPRPSS